ncbi:hypothetical protein PTTG_29266 [Puccinia triticina 1-1 BBBD Race 1]|uniref:GCM domain-containing protein n=1 Tax=Puccinia triticina (isolate 1-1 / race 1 (BBBD)) TaxID=630390 RepID=A0A180G5V3_PUCT1|nr:hypothetical protein PTTG_29266 [Puccinia triticina 1-1 BBBD Race 1]
MDREFTTYINHGCVLDRQGYPLYPNGSTTFVRCPGDEYHNFGAVGFSKESSNGSNSDEWKTIRIYCLGVFWCDQEGCDYIGPPPTGVGKLEEHLTNNPKFPGLAGRCPGKVIWDSCSDTQCRFDYHQKTRWCLLCYQGVHNHQWPSSKKPDPQAKKDLTETVMKNPRASALQLKIGNATGPGHPSNNTSADGSQDPGSSKDGDGGDRFMDVLFECNGFEIISILCKRGHEHFTFQTNWMSQRLLDCGEAGNNLYSGGLISDVTYRFFNSGYLLTTSMYCDGIGRWIPVQLSWIQGLSKSYYKFLIPSLLQHKRENMARSIVDFSKAQQRGFVAAYMEVFGESNPNKALRKLKGCRKHFWQSITRVKRNHAVIMADKQALFESKCLGLLQPCEDDGPTHNEKVEEMWRRFPKNKAWLDWWTMADVKAMLFPSHRKMLEDCPNGDNGLPSSTNAQESMHRVYYMFSYVGFSGKKTLKAGFAELYAFFKALEMDHAMIQRGCPIRYGTKARNQEDRQWAALNDGRAPDTTQALLDHPKKRPKLGRPPNSQNINRSPHTTFKSYSALSQPNRKNQCWLLAALDSLYAVYSPLWLRSPGGKKTNIFHCLVSHFTSRTTNEMIQNKNLKSILTQGSNKLFEAAQNLHPESFIPGEFSSCDFFMEIALSPQSNSLKVLHTLFTVQESRTFTCPRKIHQKQADHPRGERRLGCLKIFRSMFEENAISFVNTGLLVTRWATSGLSGTLGLQCKGCNALAGNKSCPKKKSGILPPSNYLEEVLTISFADSKSPPHLYFHINVTTFSDEDKPLEFMGQMNWPFKLMVAGEVYTLMLQGYWGGHHYWGKVLRKVCGVTGVWLHNDWVNGGYAQMCESTS